MGVVRRLWSSDEPVTHQGRHYRFADVAITPQPVQRPLPAYIASSGQIRETRLACGAATSACSAV
jgi:alkanesulfonate monooxygenase SsuD/methylene tetrahydromethanopterin reductase-like flavin-dependent oxidoreductase (luciferase family)